TETCACPGGCWPFKRSSREEEEEEKGRSILAAVFLSLSVSAPGPRRLKGFPERGQVLSVKGKEKGGRSRSLGRRHPILTAQAAGESLCVTEKQLLVHHGSGAAHGSRLPRETQLACSSNTAHQRTGGALLSGDPLWLPSGP
ncbi:hypothetical protein ILYODFUR_009551, partial [Ilyodon furcidens]